MPDPSPIRVVAIGGGTGLSALLQGLKHYVHPVDPSTPPVDITAVVTVTDDGGSSGRLRRELEVLPPGDIRNCLVALSEDEGLLSRLFQYRFQAGRGLKGHSFGNLFLSALTHVMGDFPDAVKASAEVLNVAGRIYPSTDVLVGIEATLADGSHVVGETRISRSRKPIRRIRLRPSKVKPVAATLSAIAAADVITLGPGSLFTSIIPNLLVSGVAEALAKSPATKACFINLMWQPGETDHFTASDHLRALHRHAGRKIVDCAFVNVRPIRQELVRRYQREQACPVEVDIDSIFKMGIKVMAGNFVRQSELVRHDPEASAAAVVRLAQEARRRREGS